MGVTNVQVYRVGRRTRVGSWHYGREPPSSGQSHVCGVRATSGRETLFLDVVAWGKQAEACGEYLAKGSAIFVDGRLQSREYDAKDGSKRTVVEVVADTVQFLTRKPGVPPAAGAGSEIAAGSAAGSDDDVPF